MAAPFIQTSLSRGEIAPSLWGHVDLEAFHVACSTLRNIFVGFRGGGYSRAGTAYVGRSKQDPRNGDAKPRLVPFKFSLTQQYALEFGDFYFRIIFQGGYVTEAPLALTGVTRGPAALATAPGQDFATGDWVALAGIVGMTELDGNTYIVGESDPATGNFRLLDLDGNPLDTSPYGIYAGGGTAARIYTVAAPYAAADLPLLKWAQSADTMSLTHPNYPPQELQRRGPLNWVIAPASFAAAIAAPGPIAASATTHPSQATQPATLPAAYAYAVTAVDPQSGQESVASPLANVTDSVDMGVTAGSIIVTWPAVAGSTYYNVYRSQAAYNTKPGDTAEALPVPAGAALGLIGQAFGNELVDSNTVPDMQFAPPIHQNPFAPGAITQATITASSGDWTTATCSVTSATGSGFVGEVVIANSTVVAIIIINGGENYQPGDALVVSGDGSTVSGGVTVGPQSGTYPGLVAYFQERRVYAASLNNPDTYWMSQPGAFLDFDAAIPLSDADAITGTPWSEQVNGLQWMVQMPLGLVTFTGSGVWQVGAPGGFASSPAAITPTNQIAAAQSSVGASATVPPQKIDWDILYVDAHDTTVRDLSYQLYFNIYTGVDISWPSSHLLTGHRIVEWAWCEDPYRVLWAARNDGLLLSLTYVKDQQITGWARHTTQGQVRGVCAVTELPTDALYVVVQRGVAAGGTRYFVERMNDRLWQAVEDAWCVDCGIGTVLPTPQATLSADAASDTTNFHASPPIFAPGDVGKTLRMGGGIAVVTEYIDAATVTGEWHFPCQQLVPDTTAPFTVGPGDWSLAAQVTRLSGLAHLAGQGVVGLADGVPVGLTVSASGTVDLPFPASKIIVGLHFTAQMQTVYLDTGNPTIQGRRKAISAVTVRIEASAPCQAGANQPDASAQSPPVLSTIWSGMANAPAAGAQLPPSYVSPGGAKVQPLFTGDLRVPIPSDWKKPGQVAVQQNLQLPLNILAVIPEVLPGDMPEVGYSARPARAAAA